jgi:hypothetical protein
MPEVTDRFFVSFVSFAALRDEAVRPSPFMRQLPVTEFACAR